MPPRAHRLWTASPSACGRLASRSLCLCTESCPPIGKQTVSSVLSRLSPTEATNISVFQPSPSEPVAIMAEPKADVSIEDVIEGDDFEETNQDDENVEELVPLKLDDLLIINDQNEESTIVEATTETTIYVAAANETNNELVGNVAAVEDDVDEYEDETLSERLWGLTEMFPEPVRNATWTIGSSSVSCAKGLYQFSRSALWVVATSAIILAAPALIENEKSQLDELNRQQQRQILLGPSAMQGTPGLSPTLTQPQSVR